MKLGVNKSVNFEMKLVGVGHMNGGVAFKKKLTRLQLKFR